MNARINHKLQITRYIFVASQDLVNITSHPQDQLNVSPGQDVTFSVNAVFSSDTDPRRRFFDWFKDGGVVKDSPGVYSGAFTDTLTVISVNESDVGVYYVDVSIVRTSPFSPFSVKSDSANLTLCKFDL